MGFGDTASAARWYRGRDLGEAKEDKRPAHACFRRQWDQTTMIEGTRWRI